MYNNGTSHWKDTLIEDQLNVGNFTDKQEERSSEHSLAAFSFSSLLFFFLTSASSFLAPCPGCIKIFI